MTDTNTRAGTIDLDSIDISLDDAKPQERPFLGTVTQDQFEDGRVYGPGDSGITLHLIVTPLGRDKGFHAWLPLKYASTKEDGVTVYMDGSNDLPIKYSMNGAFGRVIESFRSTFGNKDAEGNTYKPGHGQLCGLTGWFVLRTLTYGKDPVTGELRGAGGRPTIIALRKATAEEIASAGGEVSTGGSKDYSAEDIEAALTILDGKKALEYQRAVMKASISPELKSDILQGTMAGYLVARGYAVQDGAVIVRATEAVTA